MDITPFRQRRERLAQRMGRGIAFLPTAQEKFRNRDTPYPYRADSYFHYLTGFPEPESVLVLIAEPGRVTTHFFCREKDLEREIWDGFRYGPDAAAAQFGFDAARPIAELEAALPELLANQPTLWYALGQDAAWDSRITAALNTVRGQVRAGKRAPDALCDIRTLLDDMRLVKDAHEIAAMRRAADISATAHRRAMVAATPGRYEYELEAELLHEFRRQGSPAPAYGSIVAGGGNACVLHYVSNAGQLAANDLVLIDAGCEFDGYAADITRTFPVNGRFEGARREVYALVLAAQAAAVATIVPGAGFDAPHDAALRVLAQGMIDLGLLTGSLDDVIEQESYKRFYMHRTSHWLGLDVHDAGDYKRGDAWRALDPGMVLTVEPGCYIRPAPDVPEAFWNIGVRIEDDALVTADGCELLTRGVPVEMPEIEALIRDGRR